MTYMNQNSLPISPNVRPSFVAWGEAVNVSVLDCSL